MLRHIVMLKFSDRNTVKAVSRKVEKMLMNLLTEVDSLISMEVGLNVNAKSTAYDLVLTADFEDEQGLVAYRVHPAHVKVLDYLKETIVSATVVDYYK